MYKQAHGLIKKALSASVGLFGSQKVPYVKNVGNMIEDILTLNGNEIAALAKQVGGLEPSVDDQATEILADEAQEEHEEEQDDGEPVTNAQKFKAEKAGKKSNLTPAEESAEANFWEQLKADGLAGKPFNLDNKGLEDLSRRLKAAGWKA